jgi:hypothetical protein
MTVLLAFALALVYAKSTSDTVPVIRSTVGAALIFAGVIAGAQAILAWVSRHYFYEYFGILLTAGAVVLVGSGALWLRRGELARPGKWWRVALFSFVPIAYVVMAFDCSASYFRGCSQVCTVLRFTVNPLVVLCVLLGLRKPVFFAFALLLAAVALVPHCICYNVINKPWIDLIGVSPMCNFLPFAVTTVSVGGLLGHWPRMSTLVAFVATLIGAAFGIGHQIFGWPW